MYLFKSVADLQAYLKPQRDKNRSIGFVPTMGALHEGHLSLLRRSLAESQCTVCSIFVNPTQFNDPSDLEQYPHSPESDLERLYQTGCPVVFMPTVAEVYPNGKAPADTQKLDFGSLATVMEGAHRPGHFQGVAQVVKRLLDIVQPDFLFMGEKDYQQLLIVREMVRQTGIPTEVIGCPTVREADGLAMSSRNQRLSPQQRQQAALIYRTLQQAAAWVKNWPPREVEAKAMSQLKEAGLEPEYFELAEARSLQRVEDVQNADTVLALVAARVGDVRLIDNYLLKGNAH